MTATELLDAVKRLIPSQFQQAYTGGVNGTCYQCPYASEPLRSDGTKAEYAEYSNDPTEAWFRCNLPTRDAASEVAWGEYAPCTEEEWWDAHGPALAARIESLERMTEKGAMYLASLSEIAMNGCSTDRVLAQRVLHASGDQSELSQ